jgi:ribosomal protein S8
VCLTYNDRKSVRDFEASDISRQEFEPYSHTRKQVYVDGILIFATKDGVSTTKAEFAKMAGELFFGEEWVRSLKVQPFLFN